MTLPSVLVINPHPERAAQIAAALERRAQVEGAVTLQQGLERLRQRPRAATVLSLDLPMVDMALVARLMEPGGGVGTMVLVTARPTMQSMLEASQLGVASLLSDPPPAEELARVLGEALTPAGEVIPLDSEEWGGTKEDEAVIGASPAMLTVFRTVGRVANSTVTVLILGESGTGKEMIARAIHRHSPRARGPFVAINCAAIPENLLESELFGHEKGAFTGAIARKVGRFERADGGTLFLDEIGDMSLALQSKILRALQEREIERVGGEGRIPVDVRVIAATNKDLRQAIAEGSFREDLFFRLAVVTVELPRLRDRDNDLELLTRFFVARHAAYYGREITAISRDALDRLRSHRWPGNVRELRNVIERAVLMARGPVLRTEHLPLDQLQAITETDSGSPLPGYARDLPLADVERLHIREVLQLVDGHMGQAAELLGIHRNTLTRKVREYELGD